MIINLITNRELLVLVASTFLTGISKVIAENISPLLGFGIACLGFLGGAVAFVTLLLKRKQANYDLDNAKLENEIKRISLERLKEQRNEK